MKCSTIKTYCDRYLNKELDDFTFQLIRKHLSTCPTCMAFFQNSMILADLIKKSLSLESLSSDFTDQIMQAVENLPVPQADVYLSFPNVSEYPNFNYRPISPNWEKGWTSCRLWRDLWFTLGNYSHEYYLKSSLNNLRGERNAG
ncbi:MAG: hypothetical protein APF81_21540 [Desulfosporosinus sp. BRH_c37]|nr:MAG: hypothetical protein APF81_21540 [Desulfosporosinus sp. BRH_c37]